MNPFAAEHLKMKQYYYKKRDTADLTPPSNSCAVPSAKPQDMDVQPDSVAVKRPGLREVPFANPRDMAVQVYAVPDAKTQGMAVQPDAVPLAETQGVPVQPDAVPFAETGDVAVQLDSVAVKRPRFAWPLALHLAPMPPYPLLALQGPRNSSIPPLCRGGSTASRPRHPR